LKTCPRCGFTGDGTHCPNDGEALRGPVTLAARSAPNPTQAPPATPRVSHAPAAAPADLGSETIADGLSADALDGASEADLMRDENFGKWAEPKARKKAADPMIGRVINGRYEVLSLLGQGGMGAVYKAREQRLRREVALKILLKEFSENETVVQRFYKEALAASRLAHPNTIRVYDHGEDGEDGLLYIAMEFLRGRSLAQELSRGGAMPPKRAIHILRQVCRSLQEAHQAGIIHRDLKPDNIFLVDIQGERDFVKVLDFGVAKLKDKEAGESTLTQAGMIFGTPKYMSPEQARSQPLDARSDVYALGVILYEMLMGRPLFSGDNPLAILIAHVNERPRRFAEVNPGAEVPPALEAVVFKAIDKDPDARQLSAEALHAELEAVDELLQGATWESLADRLPGFLPGADGTPSMVGPAILLQGQSSTLQAQAARGDTIRLDEHGRALGPAQGGGTVNLQAADSGGLVVGSLPSTFSDDAGPAQSKRWAIAGAVLIGLAATAAWLLVTPADRGVAPTDTAAAVASTARPVEPIAPPPSVGAATPQASAPPSDAAMEKACVIATDPPGARVFTVGPPETQVGVTRVGLEVRISRTTEYVVRLAGYIEQTLTLDPSAPSCFAQIKLKPAPGVVSRTKPAASPASEPRRPIVLPNGALIPSPATLAPRGLKPVIPSTPKKSIDLE
jgi:serine/threonine-protein kinase